MCLASFAPVVLLHVCVSGLGFNKQGPYKDWVIKRKKKAPDGFTGQIWSAPSNFDVLVLPLHQIVSGFWIDEWQEKRLDGVDKGFQTEQ